MTKKASVIIPCYNTAENISRTLHAFYKQAVPSEDYEIIVVDDCSTDDTAAEILQVADALQIRFIQNKENSGRALTRNRGLDIATGEIIIFSDGDTVPCESYLQGHLESHARYAKEQFVVIGAAAMPEDLEITPLMYLGNVVQTMNSTEYIDDDPYNWLHFSTLNVSLKRAFLGSLRFDDARFRRLTGEHIESAGFEDTELAQRLAQKGMQMVHVPSIRAFHYHFRSPDEYISKVFDYGKRFAAWTRSCDPEEAYQLNLRMNYLLDRKNLLSLVNAKECMRRLVVNDYSYPVIRRLGAFFEGRNERLSLFFYQKLYKYLFIKGYFS